MKRPVYGLTIVAITSLALILVARFEVSVPERKSQGAISDHQAKAVAIPIAGMTCASCSARVKRTLESIDGVREVEVSLERREARVEYLDGKVSPGELLRRINDLGYRAGAPKLEGAR